MGYKLFPDHTGILLLEPTDQTSSENAVIYNIDGSLRWRLPFPTNIGSRQPFDQVGISDNELITIGIVNGRYFKFFIDFDKLKYNDISPTR